MADDLSERLRRIARGYEPTDYGIAVNLDDAADALDQQREEIERLRSLLVRALPCVASEAEMMDAMDRHAPLPEEDMPAVGAAADKLYILRNEIETALSSTTAERRDG